jgi:hypothetical protein
MGDVCGSGYFGSATLLTSTANVELIQQHKPSDYASFSAKKFKFTNKAICTIKINDSDDAIYLAANEGFESNHYDMPIYYFYVVTNGIQYTYWGTY